MIHMHEKRFGVRWMLKSEIEVLQKLLNDKISKQDDYMEIYELSTKLDILIVDYYKKIKLEA